MENNAKIIVDVNGIKEEAKQFTNEAEVLTFLVEQAKEGKAIKHIWRIDDHVEELSVKFEEGMLQLVKIGTEFRTK